MAVKDPSALHKKVLFVISFGITYYEIVYLSHFEIWFLLCSNCRFAWNFALLELLLSSNFYSTWTFALLRFLLHLNTRFALTLASLKYSQRKKGNWLQKLDLFKRSSLFAFLQWITNGQNLLLLLLKWNKTMFEKHQKSNFTICKIEKKKIMFSPGIEPGTFCVLDRCDNHYTTKTRYLKDSKNLFCLQK